MFKNFLVTVFIVLFALPLQGSADINSWQKGISLRLRSQPVADVEQSLRDIAGLGANFLTITPGWVTDSISSSNVDRKANTPPDALLEHTIDYAHSLGLQVMLKPHLDLKDMSRWRANIDPSNKPLFFANYKAMLLHYADMAERHGVAQLAIGAELHKLSSTASNEPYWRDIIQAIRGRYGGLLTYSALFGSSRDELNGIPFWDALDIVGLSAYQPVASDSTPTPESIKARWAEIEAQYIYPAYLKYNKPIIVAEVGWKSADGAGMKPESSISQTVDLQEQADLYKGFLEFWKTKDYFDGVHFWDWWPDPNKGGPNDNDFTPQRKPAEDVIGQYFLSSPPPEVESLYLTEAVATGLEQPVALGTLADGRIFIGEKASGKIKIVKDGTLLPESLLDLNDFIPDSAYLDTFSERGLLGLVFHPDFSAEPAKPFLYVFYTICTAPNPDGEPGTSNGCLSGGVKNRVSRFTVDGDRVLLAAGETIMLDGIPSPAGYHNAGWIGFGADHKLYIAVGDGGAPSERVNSQKINSLNGKILRINDDGTIPADNPWRTEMRYVSESINPIGMSKRREIWAMGMRNPWRCRFNTRGMLYCGDVGEHRQEEVDIVARGGNYGWPYAEGTICPAGLFFDTSCPTELNRPVYTYNQVTESSITGGDFGARTNFPNSENLYFYADYTSGFVKSVLLDGAGVPIAGSEEVIAEELGGVVDLIAGPDGNLYYLDVIGGTLGKISPVGEVNERPVVRIAADPTSGPPPLAVRFSSAGSLDPDGDPLFYQWVFGDGLTSDEENPEHLYSLAGLYRAVLKLGDGLATSTASIDILVGSPPVATIHLPTDGARVTVGEPVALRGEALDPESGFLASGSLSWKIILRHDGHTHPYIENLVGAEQSFVPTIGPDHGEDIRYEIILSAIDSTGLSGSTSLVVYPEAAPPPPPLPPPPPEPEPDPVIVKVFSPAENAIISGEKKLKVYIENVHPSTYVMTYNVDSRGEVLMQDAPPYKQAKIQFDNWTWNGRGPYVITFTAWEIAGALIDREILTIFVRH